LCLDYLTNLYIMKLQTKRRLTQLIVLVFTITINSYILQNACNYGSEIILASLISNAIMWLITIYIFAKLIDDM